MQEKEKRNGLLERVSSSMVIVAVFVILCVGIAAVIGVYSIKKAEQAQETGASQEETGMYAEETESGETDGQKDTQARVETTATDVIESQSEETGEIIFESRTEDGIFVTMTQTNGWGEEDDLFAQYDIVIVNERDTDISEWCIRIQIGTEAVCNNIWNGTAELENGVLTITPADFNQTIGTDAQANVGIIIEKPDTPALEGMTFKTE